MVNFRSVIFLTLAASYGYAQGFQDIGFVELLKSQIILATIESIDNSLTDDVQNTSIDEVYDLFGMIFSHPEIKDNLIPKITVSDDNLDFCEISKVASKFLKDIQASKDFDQLKKLFPSANNFNFATVAAELQADIMFDGYEANIKKAKTNCLGSIEETLQDLKKFLDAFKSSVPNVEKQNHDKHDHGENKPSQNSQDDIGLDDLLKSQIILANIESIDNSLSDDVQNTSIDELYVLFDKIFSHPEIKNNLIPKITVSDDNLDFCEISKVASKSLKDIQASKDFDQLKKLFPSANNFNFATVVAELQADIMFDDYEANIKKAKTNCLGSIEETLQDLKNFLDAFKSLAPKKEPKPEEPKPVEPKPEEPKPVGPKPDEPKPEEPKPVGPKPDEPKLDEPKPVGPKPVEPKSEEPKPVESKPVEPKPEDCKPPKFEPEILKPKEHKHDGHKAEEPKKKVLPEQSNGACSYGIHLVSGLGISALLTIL